MPFELIVLGSASPYPRPGAPCSGTSCAATAPSVWLDAGPGTLAALQEHTALTEVDAIWISHLHADHVADLLPAVYALLFADRGRHGRSRCTARRASARGSAASSPTPRRRRSARRSRCTSCTTGTSPRSAA